MFIETYLGPLLSAAHLILSPRLQFLPCLGDHPLQGFRKSTRKVIGGWGGGVHPLCVFRKESTVSRLGIELSRALISSAQSPRN